MASAEKNFANNFFTLTVDEAQRLGPYDIIIVGTGIGGGVLAADLFKTNSKIGATRAKSILVIEKGGLVFHSHCLNTARPQGLSKDRGQQNDTFFAAFKDHYAITPDSEEGMPNSKWKGGPMYNLGGRSAAWGLFVPRVHDTTLRRYFPTTVFEELKEKWYEEAEGLMNLSLPQSKVVHQHLIEHLNMEDPKSKTFRVNWFWGRIASEFKDERNFDFAEGAYSTIDKLLEIMMSKFYSAEEEARTEHSNFELLLNTEVRRLILDGQDATGVLVKTAAGGEQEIKLNPGGRVILCAGSVASPAILLRSGIDLGPAGGHITDHDILYRSMSFRYMKPGIDRSLVGAMKLQTYFELDEGIKGLANISLDASSFLPRGKTEDKNLPTMIVAFILPAPLEPTNTITLPIVDGERDLNGEPKIHMIRSQAIDRGTRNLYLKRMEDLTKVTMEVIKSHLKLEFIERDTGPYLSYLELGGVAHELGSLPMPNKETTSSSLDENLKFKDYNNIYVCDLSIFPMSPEANPTLTLAALSLRLSNHLLSPRVVEPEDYDTVSVVNRSGETVVVSVSNEARGAETQTRRVLFPGGDTSWTRRAGTAESVFVYRTEQSEDSRFRFKQPEVLLAYPGTVVDV